MSAPEWRPIPGFPRYEISSEGLVRWANPAEKFARKKPIGPDGRGMVSLSQWGRHTFASVAKMLREVFPEMYPGRPPKPPPGKSGMPKGYRVLGSRMSEIENDPRLGVMSDWAMADAYGVSRELVRQVRARKGVPIAPSAGRRPRPCPALEALGPWRDRLGAMSDREIAREAGVSLSVVSKWRASLGIPQFRIGSVLDAVRDRLGKEPDSHIAWELSINPVSVLHYRQRHGIPACPRRVA